MFANVITEEDNVRAAGKMKKEEPELYKILQQSFKDRIKNMKASDDLKEFFKFYYDSTADMVDGSKEEMEKHHKAVRAKYVNLDQKTQQELKERFLAVKMYLDGPSGEMRQAYNKLSDEQKLMYKSYFNDATKQLTEDKVVRMVARMHKDDPGISLRECF
ncbi:hypothetical protein M3Y97_01137800 [Aphelenchoides bicaudatus]|nr:hypothetical protein M3Y97_01137800 [Aphelenchoides bicaudatus]